MARPKRQLYSATARLAPERKWELAAAKAKKARAANHRHKKAEYHARLRSFRDVESEEKGARIPSGKFRKNPKVPALLEARKNTIALPSYKERRPGQLKHAIAEYREDATGDVIPNYQVPLYKKKAARLTRPPHAVRGATYCVHDKRKTPNLDSVVLPTTRADGRVVYRMASVCGYCGHKKSTFVAGKANARPPPRTKFSGGEI